MFNQNKKYGYIQKNKSSSKNKNLTNEQPLNFVEERYPNLNISNQPNIINNQNNNENNSTNNYNEREEYFDSDIDDPKYMPNYILFNNKDKNMSKNYNDNLNNEFGLNNQNIIRNSRHHNYDNIENLDLPKDNFHPNKNILDLQNENELLKQELLKKSETIRTKDELISEFQNIYKDLKARFEQYELKNSQLKQQIKFLETQIKNNQTLNKTQSNIMPNQEVNEKNILLFKQQISELESDYNDKTKKLVDKFKDKENKIRKEHDEEIARLNKNIENIRLENSKLKTEISNNKVEIDSLKAKLESKDYEKNTYLDQKEKDILKLKEKISEQERDMEFKEKELKQRISKLEDQISLMKQENNNIKDKLSESKERYNESEAEVNNQKNISSRLNNELNQVNLSLRNKDSLIDQLKNQIEGLNDLLAQSEEDLKLFEENKQQEFKEYSEQIEILIQEKNFLSAQNMELTENLSLANENLKELNELISNKYADVEAELFNQTNKKENLEKKYKNIFNHMKNKQNLLNEENNKLKEIINNQEGHIDNSEDIHTQMNNIQNLNLYKKINGDNRGDNLNNLNFETNIGNERNNNNNLININENNEQTFGNYNINKDINRNNRDYINNYNTFIDTKGERQKKTLNNFRMLLNKMDEKIENH